MNIEIHDKLDMMIALVAKDCGKDDEEMFDSLDTSSIVLSQRFHRKMLRMIRRYQHAPIVLTFKKSIIRVAIAIMIIMSLSFTTIMAVPMLREAVFGAVIEWYENYLTIRYEPVDEGNNGENDENDKNDADANTNEEPNDEQNSTVDVPETVPPTEIEVVRKPTALPEGTIEDVVVQNKTMVYIDYYLNNELICTFNQALLKDRDKYFDNESAILDTVDIRGKVGTVVQRTSKAEVSVIWCDEQYIYLVYTQKLNVEELVCICRSLE